MALVNSLLTAMVRADGDAMVMHVGERPYVVAGAGTLDLSTQILNLDAMTGMLQQLLPPAVQDSLQEFGAVEHRLPAHEGDTFTVVAARGGNDIWIEIRRRQAAVAAAPVAVTSEPAAVETAARPAMVESVPEPVLESVPEPVAAEVEAIAAHEISLPIEAPPVEAAAVAEVSLSEVEQRALDELQVTGAPQPVAQIAEIDAADPPLIAEAPVPEPEAPAQAAEIIAMVAETPEPVAEGVEIADTPEPVVEIVEVVAGTVADTLAELPEPVAEMAAEAPEPVAEEPVAEELIAAEAPLVDVLEGVSQAEESLPEVPGPLEGPMVAEAPPAAHEAPAAIVPFSPAAFRAPKVPELAPVLQMTRTVRIEVPPRSTNVRVSSVERLLRLAAARAASALFVTSGCRPSIRVEGDIRPLEAEPTMSRADVEAAVIEIVPETAQEAVGRGESTEWITEFADLGRVRCITFTDHRGPGVVFRMIATRAATAEQLGLSPEVQALATEAQGLVLVAGLHGSGKSTLVSALVDLVNRQRAEYVVTLERQIRLVHDNRAAMVSQREIFGGADEALIAARAALREGPDVLVVDDLVSAQMVPLLLQAASEALVFVAIAAPSMTDAVERFVELAPAGTRAGVQAAMAESFRGGVGQVLLKKAGGGRVAAREVLLATAAVTRVISDSVPGQLQKALEGGRKHGMVPMADALVGLVHSGVVDVREAFRKSPDRDRLLAGLRHEGIDTSVVERLA